MDIDKPNILNSFTVDSGAPVDEGKLDGLIPTGGLLMTPDDSVPSGFLECDGSSLNRETYTELFNVIGTKYGTDSTAEFNIPDYRGYFLRGWDHGAAVDPDSASRTDRGDGTTGDNVGTKQDDEFESHRHGANETSADGGSKLVSNDNSGSSDWFTEYAGGNETRPKNINVIYCIKY